LISSRRYGIIFLTFGVLIVETHRSLEARPVVIFIGRRMIISTGVITVGRELPLEKY
jgi:hypothetical protein